MQCLHVGRPFVNRIVAKNAALPSMRCTILYKCPYCKVRTAVELYFGSSCFPGTSPAKYVFSWSGFTVSAASVTISKVVFLASFAEIAAQHMAATSARDTIPGARAGKSP